MSMVGKAAGFLNHRGEEGVEWMSGVIPAELLMAQHIARGGEARTHYTVVYLEGAEPLIIARRLEAQQLESPDRNRWLR